MAAFVDARGGRSGAKHYHALCIVSQGPDVSVQLENQKKKLEDNLTEKQEQETKLTDS